MVIDKIAPALGINPSYLRIGILALQCFTLYRGVCFPAGTLVHTENGLAPIETIDEGTKVWAYDTETGEWRLCEVLRRMERRYDGEMVTIAVGDEQIMSTAEHPYWILDEEPPIGDSFGLGSATNSSTVCAQGTWVEARNVREADLVLSRLDGELSVGEARPRKFATTVYNLNIATLHNYAVGRAGVLVHNDCTGNAAEGEAANESAEVSRTNWGPEHGTGNVAHNNAIESELDAASARGATSLRKNRVQRDASGGRVYAGNGSYTRPDASYVENGVRVNYNRVSDPE